VSSSDQRVDCVGACVGVRGNRIKNIVDELAGERIDIVRYSTDPETLIRASLQPAEVDQVLLCDMIGRAIVLVREDQLSLAIGRKGQNVRLASKLCGWDIEIMTNDELEEQIDRAVGGFMQIEGMNEELAQRLVEQGYLSYDDLSVIEPDALMEMGGLTEEQVQTIVDQAEVLAEQAEKVADEERRRKKEADAAAAAAEARGEKPAPAAPAAPAATPEATAAPAAEPAEASPANGDGASDAAAPAATESAEPAAATESAAEAAPPAGETP
jgi:N utilization substance protein A